MENKPTRKPYSTKVKCSNCKRKFHGDTECKPSHGGKRANQTGRPAELGPTTQKGIRFEDRDIDSIDFLRGDLPFAEYIRQAVKEKIAKGEKY